MRQEKPEPVYDRDNPRRSGAALLQFHLRQLGLGEWWFTRDGKNVDGGGAHPTETGWCRAGGVTEAAWPEGADLCVVVDWFPGSTFRRNDRTGKVPRRAEHHWKTSLADVADALETRGFVVERNGPPQGPEYNSHAETLVYRVRPGVEPARLPADAWEGATPHPPNFKDGYSWYPAPHPVGEAERVLTDSDLSGISSYFNPLPKQGIGQCSVNVLPQLVWPYRAELAAWVRWWPDERFQRDTASGGVPEGAAGHWAERVPLVGKAFASAGYEVRQPERHQGPGTDEHADFIVYRVKQ